jgi:cytochrome c oxidase subunit 1
MCRAPQPRRSFVSEIRVLQPSLRTSHKIIGLRYLWLALVSVFLGMIMSLVMRLQLMWPAVHFIAGSNASPATYSALTLLHGSLMVFVVLTCAPQAGFGSYFLPTQIGAAEMAYPNLSRIAFWLTVVSVLGMVAAFFFEPQSGLSLWLAGVAVFCVAAILNALNFAVTTIDLRAKGMTLPRMPITVWAWFLNAILGLLIFSILLATCVLLLSDRIAATHFFSAAPAPVSSALLAFPSSWQRLFWFFAEAQVYIAILPCFGIVTHLLATFSRKPVFAHRAVVLALCAVGLLGFWIWGEHTFATGLNPEAPLVFSLLASSLGIPASILLVSWFGTLWNAEAKFSTAMLFALGFVSLFVSGGLSGLFLSAAQFRGTAPGDDFVTGHYHLVMGIAATFAMIAALFFWFPKMFGRSLDERLGKLHFWLTFAGVYCLFMPMHWLGLISRLRNPANDVAAISAGHSLGASLQTLVTFATVVTIAAQGIFVVNVAMSLLRTPAIFRRNPWRATTLEWASSPSIAQLSAGYAAAETLTVHHGPYEFLPADVRFGGEDFVPQDSPALAAPPARPSALGSSPEPLGST